MHRRDACLALHPSVAVVGGASMPKKLAKRGAHRRVFTPDTYLPWQFLNQIRHLHYFFCAEHNEFVPLFSAKLSNQIGKLSGLARIVNNHLFRLGLTSALLTAYEDTPLRSEPIYREHFIRKFEEVRRTAKHLQELLNSLVDPKDHTSLWAGEALKTALSYRLKRRKKPLMFDKSEIFSHILGPLAALAEATKTSTDYSDIYGIKQRGKPRGVSGFGAPLTRFIAHLEFAARASGGAWTLNKNDERGTLIEALGILAPMLPGEFLPPNHPYSSYQKILTDARLVWRDSSAEILIPSLAEQLAGISQVIKHF
jgi:hypothetical protein